MTRTKRVTLNDEPVQYVIEVRSSELPEGTLNKRSDSVSELGTLSSSQEDDFVLVAGAPSISDYVANVRKSLLRGPCFSPIP